MQGTVQDIETEVLLDALNDPSKAESLMAQRGWTEADLLTRAEELNKSLIESMASINIV